MKITTINKQAITQIRDVIKANLQQVENDLGIEIKFGNCRYDTDTINFSNVVVKVQGALDQEAKDLEWVKQYHKDIDFDKVANVQGQKFKIVGYKMKAKKNHWVALDVDSNKKYVLPMSMLTFYFKKQSDNVVPFPKKESSNA